MATRGRGSRGRSSERRLRLRRRCDLRPFHDTVIIVKSVKKAASRLERHRSEMRRRGFKLVQLWVPDPDAPGFRGAVQRTRKFLAAHPDAEWDTFARETLDGAPGWEP